MATIQASSGEVGSLSTAVSAAASNACSTAGKPGRFRVLTIEGNVAPNYTSIGLSGYAVTYNVTIEYTY